MSESSRLRSLLVMGASAVAILGAAPAFAQDATTSNDNGTTVGEVVVTAQKREEAIQDVPIAVSAFSQETLEAQGIEGGPDLMISIPNVSFAKSNFTNSFNFQVRGIGTSSVGVSGDSGVGIHQNNAPLQASNLFEAEFYDVERVEVLRGPQGTLYGRNATGGVVNIITAKPSRDFEAMAKVEVGNYETRKLSGMVNMPLGDMFALRVAGHLLKRGGFVENTFNGHDVDDRDLWSTRVTLGFNPSDRIQTSLMWERFDEEDNRARIGKQLCTKDPGPATLPGPGGSTINTGVARQYLTQGCLPGSLYDDAAYGTINTASTLTGVLGNLIGFTSGDLNAGDFASHDLRAIESYLDPIYRSQSDLYQFNFSFDVTDELQFTALTSYAKGRLFSQLDYNRNVSPGTFNNTPLTPGGFFNDPQVGLSNTFRTLDYSIGESKQFSQELRLQSNYAGPLNFNVGGIYFDYKAQSPYYVFGNSLTISALALNARDTGNPFCDPETVAGCIGIDPNPTPSGKGHNYYVNFQPYHLKSKAAFGEVYYEATDNLKFTLGLRYTHDHKEVENFATALLAPGYGMEPIGTQEADFKETTGRLGFDWKPDLGFTDETLIYAFYSKGYKGGGMNPPAAVGMAGVEPVFEPEFVNAIEVGTKNTILDGSMTLNLTGFHYDYQGYQISKIVNRTSINENIDAKVYGLELETLWQPIHGLRLNANVGYLHTEIGDGVTSINTMDRTQGDPDLIVVKDGAAAFGSNCVLNKAGVASLIALGAGGAVPLACAGPGVEEGSFYQELAGSLLTTAGLTGAQANAVLAIIDAAGGPTTAAPTLAGALIAAGFPAGSVTGILTATGTANFLANGTGLYTYDDNVTLNLAGVGEGIAQNLSGNRLPNSPEWTLSLGAQYTWDWADWSVTPRIDYYRQSDQYARIYNTEYDHLQSWENVNLSLILANDAADVEVQFYVHNALDDTPITGAYTGDDTSLFTNVYTLEPRLYGFSLTKRW